MAEPARRVSVIIPARNSSSRVGVVVEAVRSQGRAGIALEVIVVDDGSTDDTTPAAQAAGARTITIPPHATRGNPAAARNRGAAAATGDPLIFLDDDCLPAAGWLEALLKAFDEGATCVGGSLAMPPDLSPSARLDYYCGWYHVHPKRPAGIVPNHPPGNLCVSRAAFAATSGFCEREPISYAHEELAWQAELQRSGAAIRFEPRAVVYHRNRPGLGNVMRRNYRWAYSAIQAKSETGAARMAWVYRYPRLLIIGSLLLAIPQSVYVLTCWLRAGVAEPLLMFPGVLAARLAYAVGMSNGGLRWLAGRNSDSPPPLGST